VGYRAGLDAMAKRKNPIIVPAGNRNPVVPARSLTSVLTELLWIFRIGVIMDNCGRILLLFPTNSPTVAHACRKRRLKWVLGAWGYNWATQSPGDIETWSSRLGVGAQG
jgi:hypothetical protein